MTECKCKIISENQRDEMRKNLPQDSEIEQLSYFFKVFGDPTRLKMLYYLSRQELCVADLANLVKMQQPAVSQQLKTLRLSRLVKYRKEGQIVYYALDDEHVSQLYDLALLHIRELER